jgi:hypothetical protein
MGIIINRIRLAGSKGEKKVDAFCLTAVRPIRSSERKPPWNWQMWRKSHVLLSLKPQEKDMI